MPPLAFGELLAQVNEPHWFASIGKLVALVLLFGLWCRFAQWIDKDAMVVNTWRVPWNLAVVGAGLVTLIVWLFVPLYVVGVSVFVLLNGGLITAYIIHRNGLVTEETKVFTPAHVSRLMAQGFSGKKKAREIKQRVVIRGAEGKNIPVPEDPVEREQFASLENLVFDTMWRRASLVEIVPAGQASKVTYEIDGITSDREPMQRAEADALLLYCKKVAGLNVEEKRKPQSGRIAATLGETTADIVVTTGGSTAGEKLTLNVLGPEMNFKVEDLGFTEEQVGAVRNVMSAEKGLSLISGPPDTGVSVTTYSIARSHDAFLNNIQTLEVNKEFTLFNITQRQFAPSDEKTFATEIQKIVRTDPDIVFLPQPPDPAGATILCRAAGHKQKVYVALPGEDVVDALKRWLEMANDARLVAASLNMITSQRLVRKLCSACKQAYKPDAAMLRKANLPPDKVFYRPPEPEYDKHGNPIVCQNCQGTGYSGRTAVFDVLVADDALRDVIRQSGGSIADVRAYLTKRGAAGLQQQALAKVLDGTTSIQEVIRVTRKPTAKPAARAKAAPKSPPDSGVPTPSAR